MRSLRFSPNNPAMKLDIPSRIGGGGFAEAAHVTDLEVDCGLETSVAGTGAIDCRASKSWSFDAMMQSRLFAASSSRWLQPNLPPALAFYTTTNRIYGESTVSHDLHRLKSGLVHAETHILRVCSGCL